MIVLITNLTDAPGHKKGPRLVDIYNKSLNPGDSIKLPADLVDKKIRSLAQGENPVIAIGSLPPWYIAAKKRKARPLSEEERHNMIHPAPPPAPAPVIHMKQVKEKEPKDKDLKVVPEHGDELGRKTNKG